MVRSSLELCAQREPLPGAQFLIGVRVTAYIPSEVSFQAMEV
jgi:hypothetical protein